MSKDLFDLASGISDDDIVDESVQLLPHNQKLYNDIVIQLKIGEQSIFYSEGTGLGKSFVFMKLVQDYFKNARVLYIVPKIAIWNNVCHYKEFNYIADRVTLATFATFNKYPNNNISCADYDVVFVDECHHMLSDIQGKNVKQFLEDMVSWDKHVFGMTATPEIEGVFVDEKCFDVSCYGLDMFEAIEQGLMPKMDIAIGIKEDIDIPNNLREQYSIVGTKTLLETVIDDYKHVTHWLAYFTTKEELEQSESELRKLFPEFKILKAYHELDNTAEVISEFETSRRPVILMTVSMFLEGMHLKNVGGVLLYRNVRKSHTYAQILGRLCVIGQKYTPVIVDVTGAILSIKQFYVPKSSRVSETQRRKYDRKDIFDVQSKSYRLFDLMDELRASCVRTYRGIIWHNQIELSRKLAGSSTLASYLFKNPDKTEEDWIDIQLKDSTYEEFLEDGKVGYYKLDNMRYLSIADVERQLGTYPDCISGYLRVHPECNLADAVEAIKTGKLAIVRRNKEEEVYLGYRIHMVKTLAEDLGISEKSLSEQISRSGLDLKEFVAQKVYRGIILNSIWIAQLARKGYDRQTILNKQRQGLCVKECIDFALDRMYTYKGIQLGTLQNVARQIGMDWRTLEAIYENGGYSSLEQVVDSYYDNTLIPVYRGIEMTSIKEIARSLNVCVNTFQSYVRIYGREKAVDYYLDMKESKEKEE